MEILHLKVIWKSVSTTWGTVCDNGWSDAMVACRQLNFSVAGIVPFNSPTQEMENYYNHAATVATNLASFGQGTGLIALTAVRCLEMKKDYLIAHQVKWILVLMFKMLE